MEKIKEIQPVKHEQVKNEANRQDFRLKMLFLENRFVVPII